jgi:hypothetical protein
MPSGPWLPGLRSQLIRINAVLGELRERGRWLLVGGLAEALGDLTGWLPGRRRPCADYLRHRGWAEIAAPVEVDVLARGESVAILAGRVRAY